MNTVLLSVVDPLVRQELGHYLSAKPLVMVSDVRGALSGSACPADLLIVECSTRDAQRRLESIEKFRSWNPGTPVIACALGSSEDLAIAAFRLGVRDYFRWPVHQRELFKAIDQTLLKARAGQGQVESGNLIGQSTQIRAVGESIRRASCTESSVLITGETGTGKELVAQSLHRNSSRSNKPLVAVNCAAIPDTLLESELFGYERAAFTGAMTAREGKLQLASGGTIFFDEVGDLNSQAQAKLLRAVETREVYPLGGKRAVEVDIRIIAATNQNLESMVLQRSFRADLLFRLNVIRIDLPPLRARATDVPILLDYFVEHFNRRWGPRIRGFDQECKTMLSKYDWPGNVRELKNVVEAVYVNSPGGLLTKADLPPAIRALTSPGEETEERLKLREALFAMNWNISKVATKLQLSRMTVYRKLAKHQITRAASY
jgi:DNA-binding NtrC family response regulator